MSQTLIIGYGNLDRGDDGAAFHVVNRLRQHLGLRPLAEDDSGLERLAAEFAVVVPQLTPELSLDAAPYHRLVLIDAHDFESGASTSSATPARGEARAAAARRRKV